MMNYLLKSCVYLLFFVVGSNILNAANRTINSYVSDNEKSICKIIYWTQKGSQVEVQTTEGKLLFTPQSENAVRVQYIQGKPDFLPEYVFIERNTDAPFQVEESLSEVSIHLPRLIVYVNKEQGNLTFKDEKGNLLLRENEHGRTMFVNELENGKNHYVQQEFYSPSDEYLFGTGQFQDGYLNIKGLPRKLTQLNTQISIPFILSNKGYGLLWHNYGMTYFNPADNPILLTKTAQNGAVEQVDVTTTEGTRQESRQANYFEGKFTVPQSGQYAILLDVGQRMARKHRLLLDGRPVMEIDNIWLPNTTSFLVDLSKGDHHVQVEGVSGDNPCVYYRKVENETVFRSPVADCIDYTVFSGTADEVISSYRTLTGQAPMMPRWSLGYIHCRERFKTQDELLSVAKKFRKENYPLDVIVQDWQYWGRYGWNAMKFDESQYPDPAQMVSELHQINMRLMVSVWSKIDRTSDLGKEVAKLNYYIPESDWIDFFNADAASFYWKNFSDRLLKPYEIDAWWQDATEPENDDLHGRMVNNGTLHGDRVRNIYPLLVNKTVYEGQRKDMPQKRVMILTRSGFSGMQRYAAATWSGDVGNDWETLSRQIAGGLNYMASGLPWWTYDAGGFFRPGEKQYKDPTYHERFLRWLQVSTFLPLMRVHGYQTDTEFWNYGSEVEKISKMYLKFRYRMLPYIYSEASRITMEGSTLMRPFVMDFPEDEQALKNLHNYMFGPSLLVAPVLKPSVKEIDVYLPQYEKGWIDFWTGERQEGGKTIKVPVNKSNIPLFVKCGSIIPLGEEKEHTEENPEDVWEIRIYPGADAHYTVYEDEGTNYNYEQGKYSQYTLTWIDKDKKLVISERKGSFAGMVKKRKLKVVRVSPNKGVGFDEGKAERVISYSGEYMEINFD